MQSRVVILYRRFGTTYRSHCPGTSVKYYHSTLRNIAEERTSVKLSLFLGNASLPKLGLLLHEGWNIFCRNVGTQLPGCTASQHTRPKYVSPTQWKPKILSTFLLSASVVKIQTILACWEFRGGGVVVVPTHTAQSYEIQARKSDDEVDMSVIGHYTLRRDPDSASDIAPCGWHYSTVVSGALWGLHMGFVRSAYGLCGVCIWTLWGLHMGLVRSAYESFFVPVTSVRSFLAHTSQPEF
jgi:hypothetical protein